MSDQILALLKSSNPDQRKQGIKVAAQHADVRYLKTLAQLYKTDPDTSVREMAKKAGSYIAKQAKAAQAPATTSDLRGDVTANTPPAQPAPAQPVKAAQPAPVSDEPDIDDIMASVPLRAPGDATPEEAQIHYDKALDLHVQDQDAEAVFELGTAFYLNPALSSDKIAVNLAAELTKLPAQEAIPYISNPNNWRELTERYGGLKPRRNEARQQLFRWLIIGIFAVVFIGFLLALLISPEFSSVLRQTFDTAFGGLTGNNVGIIAETPIPR